MSGEAAIPFTLASSEVPAPGTVFARAPWSFPSSRDPPEPMPEVCVKRWRMVIGSVAGSRDGFSASPPVKTSMDSNSGRNLETGSSSWKQLRS